MFSDHLRKIDQAPNKTLLLVASGLVIVCQLVAMALVAGEQVQKAQMRGDSDASRQAVVASCVESSRGMAVKGCLLLGNPGFETGHSNALPGDRVATPLPNGAVTGFMSASLDAP